MNTSDSVKAADSEKPLPSLPTALGPSEALTLNAVRFSIPVNASKPGLTGFDFMSDPAFTCFSRGRASAEVRYPLNVSLVPVMASGATFIMVSGAAALRPAGSTAPASLGNVIACPGSVTLSVGSMGGVATGVLHSPPLVQSDALVKQVYGSKPRLYWSFSMLGVDKLYLVVSGEVVLSGVGTVDPF
jgi:hypothetical protein